MEHARNTATQPNTLGLTGRDTARDSGGRKHAGMNCSAGCCIHHRTVGPVHQPSQEAGAKRGGFPLRRAAPPAGVPQTAPRRTETAAKAKSVRSGCCSAWRVRAGKARSSPNEMGTKWETPEGPNLEGRAGTPWVFLGRVRPGLRPPCARTQCSVSRPPQGMPRTKVQCCGRPPGRIAPCTQRHVMSKTSGRASSRPVKKRCPPLGIPHPWRARSRSGRAAGATPPRAAHEARQLYSQLFLPRCEN